MGWMIAPGPRPSIHGSVSPSVSQSVSRSVGQSGETGELARRPHNSGPRFPRGASPMATHPR